MHEDVFRLSIYVLIVRPALVLISTDSVIRM